MIDDERQKVWVVDTSSIVQIRRMYDPSIAETQHRRIADYDYCHLLFDFLEALVTAGRLTFPVQVRDELNCRTPSDLASDWSKGCARQRRYNDPRLLTVKAVLEKVPNIVDHTKLMDDADPYVVAQALDLQATGILHAVVTEDRRDRRTTSITTACIRLGLPCIRTLPFLEACGAPSEPT